MAKMKLSVADAVSKLHILSQNGQVTHFVEKLPTVNDIFIQTVSK